MKNNAITSRDVDFAKWYTDVVRAAKLADYTSVKGCIAIEPNGYAIWEKIQSIMDKKFKELGHVNVQMPLLIPEKLFNQEKELIEGFAPELVWVTEVGEKKLDERFAIRSTSETVFCDYYKKHITSYKDLPKLYNQWCNVFRYEKETRPFLRSREFLWQEGHTVHATDEEAIEETSRMIEVYKWFNHEILAIPSITGKKTEKEKFAGAEWTLTNEDLMYNGVCLQDGTSHYFGQKFSKAYDVKFTNKDNKEEYAYYTTWGKTTRAIAAIIMVHADDYGLVLPPRIAPKQVVIVPIGNDDAVLELCNSFNKELNDKDVVSYVDNSNKSPGFKFAEAEVNGIPIRVEVGARDLANNTITVARRDTREKINIKKEELTVDYIKDLLETIQKDMYNRALERQNKLTFEAHNMEDMERILNKQPGFIHAMWCGDEACELKVKEIRGCKSRCIVDEEPIDTKCVCCGKDAKHHVIWGIQY
ncbi:MAG: proline--tRNA ligase [Bacilli bacterium]|nr:proline--tRNA ligase [Bacilli bacterium]MBR1936108.1 proline--tRNA ligase [Bacilli bacterium]